MNPEKFVIRSVKFGDGELYSVEIPRPVRRYPRRRLKSV
jgi:hypothetical protein